MNSSNKTPSWIGNALSRLCLGVFFLLFLLALNFNYTQTTANHKTLPGFLIVILGIVMFISLIFSFRKLYALWMRFGEFLNKCMSTLIFTVIYFSLVPLFSLWLVIAKLFTKDSPESVKSFWIDRKEKAIDLDFFKRMG